MVVFKKLVFTFQLEIQFVDGVKRFIIIGKKVPVDKFRRQTLFMAQLNYS